MCSLFPSWHKLCQTLVTQEQTLPTSHLSTIMNLFKRAKSSASKHSANHSELSSTSSTSSSASSSPRPPLVPQTNIDLLPAALSGDKKSYSSSSAGTSSYDSNLLKPSIGKKITHHDAEEHSKPHRPSQSVDMVSSISCTICSHFLQISAISSRRAQRSRPSAAKESTSFYKDHIFQSPRHVRPERPQHLHLRCCPRLIVAFFVIFSGRSSVTTSRRCRLGRSCHDTGHNTSTFCCWR